MTFFTHRMKLQLKALGDQEHTDDPKVVAIFNTPDKELTFYITEYRAEDDYFFGYIKSPSMDCWGGLPKEFMEVVYAVDTEILGEDRMLSHLSKPTPISELLPALKEPIIEDRLNRLREKQEKNQDKEQEPEQ